MLQQLGNQGREMAGQKKNVDRLYVLNTGLLIVLFEFVSLINNNLISRQD